MIFVLVVSARPKTKILFNGRDYTSIDEMPVSIGAAYDRAAHEAPMLHYGARLAAKLKARIIVNDTEFNNPGEMSVDDRHLYHEALEAVFPPTLAISVREARKIRQRKVSLIVAIVSVVAGAVYLWLHGFFG